MNCSSPSDRRSHSYRDLSFFFFFQIGFGKLCQASSLEPKHYFSSLILCQGILTSGAVSVVEQRTDFHGNDKETT